MRSTGAEQGQKEPYGIAVWLFLLCSHLLANKVQLLHQPVIVEVLTKVATSVVMVTVTV